MPNYVYNTMKFKKEDREKFEKFMNGENFDFNKLIQMPKEFEEMGADRFDIAKIEIDWRDFTKNVSVNPENVEIYIEKFRKFVINNPEKYPESFKTVNSEIVIKEWGPEVPDFQYQMYRIKGRIKYGFESWFDWCNAKWGTKWNAIGTEKEEDYISFSTAWSTPLPIFEKMIKINPDTGFQVKYYDEDTGNNCGIIEYFPNIEPSQPFDNVASVEYNNETGELKVLKTASISKDLAKDWNANVILTEKGLLIIYNDYTEYRRHSKCFSEKEKKENFKKWYLFADGLEEDWNEIYEED